MARPVSRQPTDVELLILRILWDRGPSPVRDIHREIERAKGTNYSTTVKMLGIMLEKGLLKRDESANPHVYRAAVSRDKAGGRMLDDLIERVYEGAAMSLVLKALSRTTATRDELDAARALLDEMEKKLP